MSDRELSSSPDFWTVFEFQDTKTGETFGVSLATLLQCLCIAERRHVIPPFEPDWEVMSIPSALREMSIIPNL
jgi:hypothetical protein